MEYELPLEKYQLTYSILLDTTSEFNVHLGRVTAVERTLRNALTSAIEDIRELEFDCPIKNIEIKYDGMVLWKCMDYYVLNKYFGHPERKELFTPLN